MPLSLSQLAQRIVGWRGPVITKTGQLDSDFKKLFYDVIVQSNDVSATAQTAADTAQTAADTAQSAADTAQTSANSAATAAASAQTAADNAAGSSTYHDDNGPQIWFGSGAYYSGDPSHDITVTFYDKNDAQIAQRVLRGSLTSSSGNIAVTSVSNSGLTTGYTLTGNNSTNVKATVTVTLADSSTYRATGSIYWSAIDSSVEGEIGY